MVGVLSGRGPRGEEAHGAESSPGSAVAAIVGSAFARRPPGGLDLQEEAVDTPWGPHPLFRVGGLDREAWIAYRHGLPHRHLPHRIPYRAQAWALREVGCGALLVTSSVGVLRSDIPLERLLLVADLVMLENRLPDGSACTIFVPPADIAPAHLVLREGLFSRALGRRLEELAAGIGFAVADRVVFGYVGGPRGKTPAENRVWAGLGVDVNSMTLAPEVVLANELGIPCAAAVTGHKYSLPPGERDVEGAGAVNPDLEGAEDVTESLERSRGELERLVVEFLRKGRPVPFGNHLYRYDGG